MTRRLAVTVAIAAIAGFGLASIAVAQSAPAQKTSAAQATPKGWNYEFDAKGNRVPKGNKVINADGSWRKETPGGRCVTVEEMSAQGVYRKFSECPKE